MKRNTVQGLRCSTCSRHSPMRGNQPFTEQHDEKSRGRDKREKTREKQRDRGGNRDGDGNLQKRWRGRGLLQFQQRAKGRYITEQLSFFEFAFVSTFIFFILAFIFIVIVHRHMRIFCLLLLIVATFRLARLTSSSKTLVGVATHRNARYL